MNAKKCIALLLSAVFAVLTLAGCGRADYSALAAKTLNEAQGNRPAVTFETHQKLTSALWAALEEAAQLSDIQQAMTRNNGMQELLTGRYSLEIYTVSGSLRPQDAAAKIAQEILDTLSGRREEGFISMVKSDGSYYAAVLTWRSSSGSGSDDSGNSGATDPDEPVKATYPVQWDESTRTLTFRKGASVAMGNTSILNEQSTLDGLNAEQGKAEGKNFDEFSLMDVVHLVVEENSGVTSIADGFDETNLKRIDAFACSPVLRTVKLDGVNSIGLGAFFKCSNLENLVISGSGDLTIGKGAFNGSLLTSVNISTSNKLEIMPTAFNSAFKHGVNAYFSGDEIYIGYQAFLTVPISSSTNTIDMTFKGTVREISSAAFGTTSVSSGGIVYHSYLKIHYAEGGAAAAEDFRQVCPGDDLSQAGLHDKNFV